MCLFSHDKPCRGQRLSKRSESFRGRPAYRSDGWHGASKAPPTMLLNKYSSI